MRGVLLLLAGVSLLAGCASGTNPTTADSPATGGTAAASPATGDSSAGAEQQRFPDIVGVEVERSSGAFTFDVTVSSPYDSEQRYADAFRVRAPDGSTVYGVRELTHPHTSEQPFTRSLTEVQLPRGVDTVLVQGRDLHNGWGGATRAAQIPGR